MADDRDLAGRIREILAGRSAREASMVGGLAFMVNMMSRGWVVVDAARVRTDEALGPWIREALDYNETATGGG